MPKKATPSNNGADRVNFHSFPFGQRENTNVLEILPPGSFVNLENHPKDLPPFQVINCKGGRCWVRQQAWGQYVQWEVEHHKLKAA
tara:strand:- start:1675 stop:1932 length:258 start_codon:yes stop_codon:yes gene_type:complete